jgi:rSAM/selenodomain-associated transferase 2
MSIGVVIPTYREVGHVGDTVRSLLAGEDRGRVRDLVVVDVPSDDGTAEEATAAGATVHRAPTKGRAAQMNHGAKQVVGDILFFVHADTRPAPGYAQAIQNAVAQGHGLGCLQLCFDRDHWALRLKCWFTRFKASGLHYGDQGLFIRRELFERIGGYNEELVLFEDLDLIERARKQATFTVLPGPITASARKYKRNGLLRMQLAFYVLYPMYRFGASQATLHRTYTGIVSQDKI